MRKITVTVMLLIASVLLYGCSSDSTATGTLKLSMTDAPAPTNYENVKVTFTKVEVSKAVDANTAGWITLTENVGQIDLLTLTNGTLQELGVKNLEEGTYNQIRLTITEAKVTVAGTDYTVNLASGTIKLTTPFTLKEGVTTELVVDFDAAHSLNYTGGTYTMTPVTRLAQVDLTGGIRGKVTTIAGATITVTAYKDGQTTAYAGTVADATGNFLVGYLEPGVYDLKVETAGYTADTSLADITVTAGNINDKTSTVITLVP